MENLPKRIKPGGLQTPMQQKTQQNTPQSNQLCGVFLYRFINQQGKLTTDGYESVVKNALNYLKNLP